MHRAQTLILAASLGINLGFAGFWICQKQTQASPHCQPASLHREIGATREQWKLISPLVADFSQSSRTLGREIRMMRCRLLDLLEDTAPDMAALKSTENQLYAANLKLKKQALILLLGEKQILSPDQYKALIKAVRTRSSCKREGGHSGGSFIQVLTRDPALSGN